MNFNSFQPPYYPFLYLFLSNWNLSSHKSLIYFHVFFLYVRHWQSFCLSLSGRLLIKAISPYQWLHHWTKWDSSSLSNYQLPRSLRKGWDLISLSPIQEELLMGPTYRSLTDNHNCSEFMSEKALLYPEETFLLLSLALPFFLPLVSQYSLSLGGHGIKVSLGVKQSIVT